MTSQETQVFELIARARQGDTAALGTLLDRYRAYLKVLALRQLDGRLGGRLDESDLVQQTCLSVYREIQQFDGDEEAQFLAWLRTIHENNIRNTIRDHFQAQKRSIKKEERLADREQLAAALQSSPSQRVLRDERAVQLSQALECIPDDQRDAVRLRYLEGWSLADITAHMERSRDATIGLLKRGLQNLRKHMPAE